MARLHPTPKIPSLVLAALAAAVAGCSDTPRTPRPSIPPVVAGLHGAELSPRVRGLVLLGELGCVACHAQAPAGARVDARPGPVLAAVGARVRAGYLRRFLAEPHGTEPGTVMPDLLRDRDDDARDAAAGALAAYLRSFSKPQAANVTGAGHAAADGGEAAARGRELFHTVGCVACHAPRDAGGAEQPLAGSEPLGRLTEKYTHGALREFLLAPHGPRPSARMPRFDLSPQEADDLSRFLLPGRPAAAGDGEPHAGGQAVAAGRALFAELGCAHCHELDDAARAPSRRPSPLRELDPTRGCMSGEAGAWPFYALTAAQRADLMSALAALDAPLDDAARIGQLLASRNCLACHERGELGGIADERAAFFTTHDPSLGQEGRLPPPLTGVGARLQPDWLADAIAHGQSERPYLKTRMPGFGEEVGGELARLLARTDELPEIAVRPLPENKEERSALLDLGRELVGDKGMNCITCHVFAGEQVGAMGALDLVHSTGRRLRPEWFAHFLRRPFDFKPITLMPEFFPDGRSTRPELGDGDAARQIDAMWHYLAEGRNVRKPPGIRRPSIELTVGDEAVILRRSVQNTGKRGISVGYPGGVNVTFDAKRLGMNQIWWGRFVDASPVWTGQGSGQARILGRPRFELPNGPAIVELPDAGAPWPEASRRELGHRFLGYDLDERQRPSFRYVSAGVEVTDTPRETTGDAVTLARTLRFSGAGDETLYFLAARHSSLEDLGDGAVRVGNDLTLQLDPDEHMIREAGELMELRVPIRLRDGRAQLVVTYATSREAGK